MARLLCDDWGCPAMVSCALHWGRSEAYWAMTQEPRGFQKGDRKAWQEACPEYQRDVVRPWMIEAHRHPETTPSGAWQMPLFVDVGGSALGARRASEGGV